MAKYRPTSDEEKSLIQELEGRFGSKQLRTLLSSEDVNLTHPERTRIMSNRRLGNLAAGRGRLTEAEAQQLKFVAKNKSAVSQLTARGNKLGHKDFRTNRAIRTWLLHGKGRDAKRRKDDDELRAIRALRFLGVDIDAGIFYVKGVSQ